MSLLQLLFLFIVFRIRIEFIGLWQIYVVFLVVVLFEGKDFDGMLVLKEQEIEDCRKKIIKR